MKRLLSLGLVSCCLFALLLAGCKEKAAPKPDESAKQIEKLHGEIADLQSEVISLREENDRLRDQVGAALETLNDAQTTALEALRVVRDDLDVRRQQRYAASTAAQIAQQANDLDGEDEGRLIHKGWPWFIKLIVIMALVLVCLLLYRRVMIETSDGEEDEDGEEFVEESDLGTIRYPNSVREVRETQDPPLKNGDEPL